MGNIHVVCQHCGIGLEVEDDVTSFNCPNCGVGIHIMPQTQAETRSTPYEELNYNRTQLREKKSYGWIPAIILLIVFSVGIGIYIGNVKPPNIYEPLSEAVGTPKPAVRVTWPLSYGEAKTYSVTELKKALQKEGFINIKTVSAPFPKIYIDFGINKIKENDIKEIYVLATGKTYHNGQIKKNQDFSSDDEVRITYYKK